MNTYSVPIALRWGGAFKRLNCFVQVKARTPEEAHSLAVDLTDEIYNKRITEIEVGLVDENDIDTPKRF